MLIVIILLALYVIMKVIIEWWLIQNSQDLTLEIITYNITEEKGDEDEPDDAPAEPRPPLADEDPLHPLG